MKKFERKTKDERRRVLLSKNNELSYTFDNEKLPEENGEVQANSKRFARPNGSALFLKGADGAVARTPISKRMLAIILAIVFVLTVIPTAVFVGLRGKADEAAQLLPVKMTVQFNGIDDYTEATVPAGQISAHLNDIQFREALPDGAVFQKALMIDERYDEKTEIKSVAYYDGNDYYSLSDNSKTATKRINHQKLVLVYAQENHVTINYNPNNGRVAASSDETGYVLGGEELTIHAIPNQDYKIGSVTFQCSNGTLQSAVVNNGNIIIPSDSITGDITVNIPFDAIANYSINDARYYNQSKYYSEFYNFDNHGGTTRSENTKGATNSLGTVQPGETAVFYIYSQKNTTRAEKWELNMLSVNGKDLLIPANEGESLPTDGIIVTYVDEDKEFSDESNSPRVLYKVEVPNVHENLEVNYYFTNVNNRRIIVKDLRGIAETGASREVLYYVTWNFYYYLEKNSQNIYETFYRNPNSTNYASNNLIVYRVKPGFNPYSVHAALSVDNGTPVSNGIRMYDGAGKVADVIKNAGDHTDDGDYNTSRRHWGKNSVLVNQEEKRNGNNLMLTDLYNDESHTWYGVALAQKPSSNQALSLYVDPYEYHVEVDLMGGSISTTDSNYSLRENNTKLVETRTHNLSDGSTYATLPNNTPVRENYVFSGWQLYDGNTKVSNHLYQINERFSITEETIDYASGVESNTEGHTFTFKAEWIPIREAPTTLVSVDIYSEVPAGTAGAEELGGKYYRHTTVTEEQVSEAETIVIDREESDTNPYYELDASASILKKTTNAQTMEGDIPNQNKFTVVNNLKLYDYSARKDVIGRITQSSFPITLSFTPPSDYPFSAEEMLTFMEKSGISGTLQESDGSISIKSAFANGTVASITNVPYGWSYSIAEEKDADAQFVTKILVNDKQVAEGLEYNGKIEGDTSVVIKNQKQFDDENIVTNKWISKGSGDGYNLTMEAYATGLTVTDEKTNAVPMDIALVIDQSGSMATKDMDPIYYPVKEGDVNQTTWTIQQALNNEHGTLFYKVGEGREAKYYEVHAGAGPLYESVPAAGPRAMIGGGHTSMVNPVIGIGCKPHYNVPSTYRYDNGETGYYYYPDSTGAMHKVFFVTVGDTGHYCIYPYYYSDVNDELNDRNEWINSAYIGWIGSIHLSPNNLRTDRDADPTWKMVTDSNSPRIRLIPTTGAQAGTPGGVIYSDSNAVTHRLSFLQIGSIYTDSGTISGLYARSQGTNYNRLYYIDDDGNEQPIGKTIYQYGQNVCEEDTPTETVLYYAEGDSRLSKLQDGVRQFAQLVADNAQQKNVEHRMSIIGFAENAVPAVSGNGNYNYSGDNRNWDYANTGIYNTGESGKSKDGSHADFKNYNTITKYNQTSDHFINRHYFVKDTNDIYHPFVYENGAWVQVDDHTVSYSNSDFANLLHYEAEYANPNLTTSDYASSLVSVNDNGAVASEISDAIDKFGAYGGTYTSYGLTMANQLFEKTATPGDGKKRIVVVFSDGEPGGNGYDEGIAKEARASGHAIKTTGENGIEIYTVGLYPRRPSNTVDRFMHELSSEYSETTTDRFAAAESAGRTEANNYGCGELNPKETYFYLNDADGKIYAVSAVRNGAPSLGWWIVDNGIYTMVTPNDEYGMGSQDFYDGRNKVTADWDYTKTYYTSSSSNSNRKPIVYRYVWYNSDGGIVEPKRVNETDSSRKQFYELNDASLASSDTYYYEANNAEVLKNAFKSIAESITTNVTQTELTGTNSFVQDVVTADFDLPNTIDELNARVTVKTMDAYFEGDTLKWRNEQPVQNPDVRWTINGDGTKTLKVYGFDYGANYVDKDREDGQGNHVDGKKVIVEIDGLVPNNSGGVFASNTDQSGVYLDNPDEDPKMIDIFPIPAISRYTYKVKVNEDDTSARVGVDFHLTENDGETALERTFGGLNFDDDGTKTWKANDPSTGAGDGDEIVFEQIVRSVSNTDDVNDDNIPDDYKLFTTVNNPNASSEEFTYSLKLDDDSKTFGEEFALPKRDATIIISSTTNKFNVSITKLVQPKEGDPDYTDKEKEFTIDLLLTDKESNAAEGKYSGIDFDSDGKASVSLCSGAARVIEIPYGYHISVDEDDTSRGEYVDSYAIDGSVIQEENEDVETLDAIIITGNKAITVYNTLAAPDIDSGVLDENNPFGIILAVLAGICGLAAAGTVVYRKRKPEET